MTTFGSNLVSNSTFDTSAGWQDSAGNTSAYTGGIVKFIGGIYIDLPALSGAETYQVSADIIPGAPGNATLVTSLGGDFSSRTVAPASGTITWTLDPSASNTTLSFTSDFAVWMDNVTVYRTNEFQAGDYIGVYYSIDDAGWVYAGEMDVSANYKEQEFYINRTGKRIQFKFAGRGGNFKIREYSIMTPEVEDDR